MQAKGFIHSLLKPIINIIKYIIFINLINCLKNTYITDKIFPAYKY